MSIDSKSTKRVLFNSGLYSITTILQKAIGFFLLPLYTMYLTPKDYGITGLVTSLTSVISMFFTLSLGSAISRFYYDYRGDEEKLRKFWGTIVVFMILNSITLGLLIIIFNDSLIMPFINGVNFYPFIFIGILTVIVSPIYTIYQSILQTKQDAGKYSINSSLNFVLMVILNITFVIVFKLGATGVLLSSLFTGLIFALYSVISLIKRKLIYLTFDKEYLVEALKYSLPLIPHLMSGMIASFASRIFLNNETSTEYLGLFNVGAQFLIILDTLQMSVNNAYVPWFYDLMSRGKSYHYKAINFADFILRANCIISLALALFIKEVIQIMTNPSYLLAWIVVPVMIIAYQIRGIYLFYVNTLFYNKRASRFIFIATLSGNILSIILSAILTERLGLMTPAIVLVIEKTLTATIVVKLSSRLEPVKFKLGKMIMYIGILIVATSVGLIFDIQNPIGSLNLGNITFKSLVLGAVCILLLRKDFTRIIEMVKKRRLAME